MRDISFGILPIRDHAFFEQTQFQRLFGNDFLKLARFAPEFLHFAGIGCPCRISGQPPLACFEEFL